MDDKTRTSIFLVDKDVYSPYTRLYFPLRLIYQDMIFFLLVQEPQRRAPIGGNFKYVKAEEWRQFPQRHQMTPYP